MPSKSAMEQRVIELNFSLYAAILVAIVALVAIGVCLGQNLSGYGRTRTRNRVNSSSSTLSSNSSPKKKKSKNKIGGVIASLSSLSVPVSPEKVKTILGNGSDADENAKIVPNIPTITSTAASATSPPPSSIISSAENDSNEGFIQMGHKRKKQAITLAKERGDIKGQQDNLLPASVVVHHHVSGSEEVSTVYEVEIRSSNTSTSNVLKSNHISLSSPSLDEFLKKDNADDFEQMDRPRVDSGNWETVDKNKGKGKKNNDEHLIKVVFQSHSNESDKPGNEGGEIENAHEGKSSAAINPLPSTKKIEKGKDVAPAVPLSQKKEEKEEVKPAEPLPVTQVYIVDAKKLGYLIGPRGETRQALQDKTGTKITMPKTERDMEGTVGITVCGMAEGVAMAVRALEELHHKGYSCLLGGEDFAEGSVSIHPMFLSEIIGPKGSCIKAIQDHTGARVTIPPNSDRKDSQPILIGLAGPRPKVEEAKKIIKDITKYRHHVVTHPGFVHAEIEMPTSLHSYIIGSKGAEIKQIQSTYKVAIHIPSMAALASGEAVNKNVVVVGDKDAVSAAESFLNEKIVEHNAKLAAAAEKEAKAKELVEKKAAESASAAAAALVSTTVFNESSQDEVLVDADQSSTVDKIEKPISDKDGEKPVSGTWASIAKSPK